MAEGVKEGKRDSAIRLMGIGSEGEREGAREGAREGLKLAARMGGWTDRKR